MRTLATMLALATGGAGCLKPMAAPPTLGYGEPYHGTGEKIFVKDSRTDWDIHEGQRLMTAEQALEASKDVEYETRRQIMKQHNATLYKQALRHRKLGYVMIGVAAATFVAGLVVSYGIASKFDHHDIMPATESDPEMDHVTATGASLGVATLGTAMILGGIGGMGYGYYGAWHQPTYEPWHVPAALNNSAYIRQPVEEYNENLQTPPPAGALRPPPGVRPQPAMPPMRRGGRS